jgi:hypothetical protein
MKSPFHRLAPFFPLFYYYKFEDSTQFNSSAPKLISWLVPKLDSSLSTIFYTAEYILITTLHGPYGKHCPYCYGVVFTDPLSRNGHPTLWRIGSRRNVFTQSLPSSGNTRHNIIRVTTIHGDGHSMQQT